MKFKLFLFSSVKNFITVIQKKWTIIQSLLEKPVNQATKLGGNKPGGNKPAGGEGNGEHGGSYGQNNPKT